MHFAYRNIMLYEENVCSEKINKCSKIKCINEMFYDIACSKCYKPYCSDHMPQHLCSKIDGKALTTKINEDIIKALQSSVKIKTDLCMRFMEFSQIAVSEASYNMEIGKGIGNLKAVLEPIRKKPEVTSSPLINKIMTGNTKTDLPAPTETQTGQIFVVHKSTNAKKRRKLRAKKKAMLSRTASIEKDPPQPASLYPVGIEEQTFQSKKAKRKTKRKTSEISPQAKKTRNSNCATPTLQFQESNKLTDVKVEIVADSNTGLITREQSENILEILMEMCGDQPTFNWLKTAVKDITLSFGERLIVNVLDIPRIRVLISISNIDAKSDIVIHLKDQNPWADVENWMFHNSYHQQGETFISVDIPEYLTPTLIERKYKLTYLSGSAYIRCMGNYKIPVEMKNYIDNKKTLDSGYPVRGQIRQILPVSPNSPEIIILEDSE